MVLAGVVGFEPTVHATKKRCLTAWLHPISVALLTEKPRGLQGHISKICLLILSLFLGRFTAQQIAVFCHFALGVHDLL